MVRSSDHAYILRTLDGDLMSLHRLYSQALYRAQTSTGTDESASKESPDTWVYEGGGQMFVIERVSLPLMVETGGHYLTNDYERVDFSEPGVYELLWLESGSRARTGSMWAGLVVDGEVVRIRSNGIYGVEEE